MVCNTYLHSILTRSLYLAGYDTTVCPFGNQIVECDNPDCSDPVQASECCDVCYQKQNITPRQAVITECKLMLAVSSCSLLAFYLLYLCGHLAILCNRPVLVRLTIRIVRVVWYSFKPEPPDPNRCFMYGDIEILGQDQCWCPSEGYTVNLWYFCFKQTTIAVNFNWSIITTAYLDQKICAVLLLNFESIIGIFRTDIIPQTS